MATFNQLAVWDGFGPESELVSGTYVIILESHKRRTELLTEILQRIPREQCASGTIGRSEINCGDLRILFYSRDEAQYKVQGLGYIAGFAFEGYVDFNDDLYLYLMSLVNRSV